MKTFYESIIVALAMYTKIPMPTITWNHHNMRYSLLILPWIGAVISIFLYALVVVSPVLNINPVFFASLAVAIPIVITGGIHLDGFCDTTDALSSHQNREEKLRIMKDPHVGAFAIIYTVTIVLLQFGAWHQLYSAQDYLLLVMGLFVFVLSRILTALAVIVFPCAKTSGLASTFADYANKGVVNICLMIYLISCSVGLILYRPLGGGLVVTVALLVFLCFYTIVKGKFGGITGDLAGFYLIVCETGVLLTLAVLGGILK
jgi:adenosylcobinamide-GDP ribazoletransferase